MRDGLNEDGKIFYESVAKLFSPGGKLNDVVSGIHPLSGNRLLFQMRRLSSDPARLKFMAQKGLSREAVTIGNSVGDLLQEGRAQAARPDSDIAWKFNEIVRDFDEEGPRK
jgi:hypothetical protein